ncbi:MarR family transcriptional regulator [Streptomyces sp. M19]
MGVQPRYKELAENLGAVTAVRRELARCLPHDCPAGAVTALMLLARFGEMRMSKLAELLAIDMSVTSRHVAQLDARGWIDRHPDPLDGRSRLLKLNSSGQELLDQVSERYTNALAASLGDWSDDDIGRLNELLARLRTSFAQAGITTRTPAQR